MTLMRRPSPFGELLSLRQAMDRIFDETLFRPFGGQTEDGRSMPLDIYTTQDTLVIEAALPGIKPEDVDISVLGDTLTLTASGETERAAEEGAYLYREVRRGRVSRTVSLPAGLRTDQARATFENGMLRLSIPKAEQARPRQIHITAPTEGTAQVIGEGEPGATAGLPTAGPATAEQSPGS